jgi:cystathionine beta-lyase
MDHPFDAITLASLRRRHSAKWSRYPVDVLPAWVAEMDYPLAAPIRAALHGAIEDDDCGYADPAGLGATFAPWARATWGWDVAPPTCGSCPTWSPASPSCCRWRPRPATPC